MLPTFKLFAFWRLSFIGMDSGVDDSGREARAAEQRRQTNITAGSNLVNKIFGGGTYGTGMVDPNALQWGKTYYDANGNPITLRPPTPTRIGGGETARATDYSGGGMPIAAQATKSLPQPAPPTPNPVAYYGNSAPLYSGTATSEGFTDDYYNSIAKAYRDYYLPQLDEQATEARRNIKLSGVPDSSATNRKAAQFETDYNRELTGLGERAQAASNQARADVESNRGNLLSAVQGGAGIDDVASRAATQAKLLSAPPAYSPIGDLFAKYATDLGASRYAARAGYQPTNSPLLFGNSSKGSLRNVG